MWQGYLDQNTLAHICIMLYTLTMTVCVIEQWTGKRENSEKECNAMKEKKEQLIVHIPF